ncbi:MAG: GDP-mannose 4,6-dehydratase [Clostridia bacterium]|nr:GDP-mannose 4,6-dehydratase [Clostridia bacterium]
MRVLVTGAGGFVGAYLLQELVSHRHEARATDIRGRVDFHLDLLDADAVHRHFAQNRYDAVVHLAGFSSVARSWERPKLALELNTFPLLHILDAVSASSPHTRVLAVGSSDQYGAVPEGKVLLDESDPCFPKSPYAVAKYAQERLALSVAAGKKLDVVLTRSFNHIGPGQETGFAVPDFACAIARMIHGAPPVIRVGNTQAHRDFTDVRDVARAYRLLIERGKSGEVYNVGSGRLYAIAYILDTLIAQSGLCVRVQADEQKMRPADVQKVGCCNKKLRCDTGWSPQIPIEDSLRAVLAYWKARERS